MHSVVQHQRSVLHLFIPIYDILYKCNCNVLLHKKNVYNFVVKFTKLISKKDEWRRAMSRIPVIHSLWIFLHTLPMMTMVELNSCRYPIEFLMLLLLLPLYTCRRFIQYIYCLMSFISTNIHLFAPSINIKS